MTGSEPGFVDTFHGACVFTGEHAVDDFRNKIRRIQPRRWEIFSHLLDTAKFFGTVVVLSHRDDPVVEGRAWSAVLKAEHGFDKRTVGVFHAWGAAEVTLCRLSSWKEVEDVLRHELTHLLQHAAGKKLLSSQVNGGSRLEHWANLNGPCFKKFDYDPAEAEAYWLQTKPRRWRRWADEFKSSQSWHGWHFEHSQSQRSPQQ